VTDPIQIWTCAAHHAAFRCGGWAHVRLAQGQVSGEAGGARNTTAPRMGLAGLVSALRGLPAAGSIRIHTTSPDLLALAGILTGQPPQDAPSEDLDLWAQILVASKGRSLSVVRAPLQPDTPIAFAAAWADLAMDKAKSTGPFTAAIPKPNLTKIRGLGS